MEFLRQFPKSRFFGLFCAFGSGCFRAAVCYLTHFMNDGNGFKVNMYICMLGLVYVSLWQLLSPQLDQLPSLLKNWKMWLLSGVLGSLSYTAAFQMFSYAPTSDAYAIFLGAELIAGICVDYFILKKLIGGQAMLSVPLTVLGIVFVCQPKALFYAEADQLLYEDYPEYNLGCLVSVLSGLGVVSWWGICGTALKNTHYSFIIAAYALFSIIIGLGVLVGFNIAFWYSSLSDKVIVVFLSLCDILNIVTSLNAISLESIYVTSIVRTAFLAAFFVADETLLKEPLSWASVVGGVAIFISVGAEAAYKITKGKSLTQTEMQPLIDEEKECSHPYSHQTPAEN